MIESLENRVLLSASARERTALPVSLVTHTTLAVQAGTMGQAITMTVSVRDAAAAGQPTGTVQILDHGNLVSMLTLTPAQSANPHFDVSTATYKIPAGAGGSDYYFGAHLLTVKYTSDAALKPSSGTASLVVKQPRYASQSGGLRVATAVPGSGAGVAAGQTANIMYTGYLVANGKIFDESQIHPTSNPYPVVVGAGNVIAGLDEGLVGTKVGETRILNIPSKLGYGTSGFEPAVPPNARLIFLFTLESIS